ncbi:TetR/AcrR family transcriptional regulator [Cryptosporangium phraense]|uniref:Helix-turn-helix transcriptional regulator n=1 Tax=Cryptosporangium phraense TaxID=2593070 RepID=A0A545ANR6_9ACTN|nr:helix-turn-helix domain-containing protein [Cryptosporangium phraense]TQS42984.1 helix-turn-helix transcriptional regulator [Cryptosporangium phraense]
MAYDNRSRAAAAQATRAAVLAAARDAFLDAGYAGTTIRAVAEAAGVSPETVYKRFGGKAGLLKAVYDVAMAGDDDPVPIAERPEFLAVRTASTTAEVAAAYAAYARLLTGRAGPLMRVVLSARGTDPDLDAFVRTVDGERLIGATMATTGWAEKGWLRGDPDRSRDHLWMLISPAVWALFAERGWTLDDYETWLRTTLTATILA